MDVDSSSGIPGWNFCYGYGIREQVETISEGSEKELVCNLKWYGMVIY